jgi:hypothetical protein
VKRSAAALALVLAVATACGGEGADSGDAAARATPDTPEYKLAVIDAGGYVNPSDPIVGSYARALDRLEERCEDSRTFLGDMAVRSQQLLAEEGISEPVLTILRYVGRAVRGAPLEGSCTSIFATYVALRVEPG